MQDALFGIADPSRDGDDSVFVGLIDIAACACLVFAVAHHDGDVAKVGEGHLVHAVDGAEALTR